MQQSTPNKTQEDHFKRSKGQEDVTSNFTKPNKAKIPI